jgi:hypothetical protein
MNSARKLAARGLGACDGRKPQVGCRRRRIREAWGHGADRCSTVPASRPPAWGLRACYGPEPSPSLRAGSARVGGASGGRVDRAEPACPQVCLGVATSCRGLEHFCQDQEGWCRRPGSGFRLLSAGSHGWRWGTHCATYPAATVPPDMWGQAGRDGGSRRKNALPGLRGGRSQLLQVGQQRLLGWSGGDPPALASL